MSEPAPQVQGGDTWNRALQSGINVFGAGRFARDVASAVREQGVKVHALLVSNDADTGYWEGIPILRVDAAALERAPTWIGLFNREAHSNYSTIRRQLKGLNSAAMLVWPQTYYGLIQRALGWRFWLNSLDGYLNAELDQHHARSVLEDDESRSAFDAVLDFRRLSRADWQSPTPVPGRQYMPDWLLSNICQPLRVVDAGAYRGETLRDLAATLALDEAWTFEPDPGNYAALVKNLANLSIPATHVPAGLSDRASMEGFEAGLGEGSRMAPEGSSLIAMVALDECLHRAPINFIKFDVEGHELAALRGARATLQRERPMLAIAGYHRWDDLWRIPVFLSDLKLQYRIRFCVHAHNSFESVFYAY